MSLFIVFLKNNYPLNLTFHGFDGVNSDLTLGSFYKFPLC